MYLDLDRLDSLSKIHPLWSGDRSNVAYFRRSDHTGDPKIPLATAIRNHVEKTAGHRPKGPVRMLAHLRYFGYCFNPVSFYYCHDTADRKVETIIAEIHNTPWGQEHLYVLPAADSIHPSDRWRRHRFKKGFHISPFMDMGIDYDWRFRLPGDLLNVHMISYEKGRRLFDASLALERKPMTRQNLTRMLLYYPAMTAKVIGLIYWQALKLTLKRAPFFTHPRRVRPQGRSVR